MAEKSDSIKVDLHVHSEASHDCNEPVELILEHAQDIDLDAIAITDHDEIENSLEAAEKAEEYGLIGIPGAEISTADGHLLALGVEELPEKGQPFMETVEEVREMGGIAIVPHPFQRTRHGVRKSKIEDVDAVEVYNSWVFTGWRNRKARRFADENKYPEVASSDAHHIGMIGKAYTEINTAFVEDEEFTADEVLEAIESGSNYMYGRRKPIAKSTWDYGKAALKKSAWLMKETLFLPLTLERKIFGVTSTE
jgi:predicted metal-dependent phosphoesterase TrpH